MNFAENFEELLRAFSSKEVTYLVVGAYALNFHGYNRSTSDLDIWVESSDANKMRIYAALESMKIPEFQLNKFLSIDFSQSYIFRIGEKPDCVEIFNAITGVKFSDAAMHKVSQRFGKGLVVDFIDWRELVVNKMLTGRTKDMADVEELQKILRLKK